jgi:hypothetical protein
VEPSLASSLSAARALLAGAVRADCGSSNVRRQVDMICALLADVETQLPTLSEREQYEHCELHRLLGVRVGQVPSGSTQGAQITELRMLLEARINAAPEAPFDEFCTEASSSLLGILRANPR